MVTQLLLLKGMEEHSVTTKHEEMKFDLEDSKVEDPKYLGKTNNFSSSPIVPFKVEAKIETPKFDG